MENQTESVTENEGQNESVKSNSGGRPPNPKFIIQPKEFDLIKWCAERHQVKDPGEFAKRIVINYCKNYYLEQKKKLEEKKIQQELEKEAEEERLIKEIEDEGGIEEQRKYIRSHKKNDDSPPVMEGQNENHEYV